MRVRTRELVGLRRGCREVEFPLTNSALPEFGTFRISWNSRKCPQKPFPTVRSRQNTRHRRAVRQMSCVCPYRRSMFNMSPIKHKDLGVKERRLLWLHLSAGLRQPTPLFQLSYASNIPAVPLDASHDFQTDRASFQVTLAINVERLVLSTGQALLPSIR